MHTILLRGTEAVTDMVVVKQHDVLLHPDTEARVIGSVIRDPQGLASQNRNLVVFTSHWITSTL